MSTNQTKGDSWVHSVVCSDPTAPTTGSPVRYGFMTGVALTDEGEGGNSATTTSVDFGPKEWDVSVKGVDGSGNSAVAAGNLIYYVDADTPKLSKKTAGYLFGIAMEAINSGSTATIRVMKLISPGAASGSGTVTATELATDAVETAKILDANVTAAKLTATLAKGFIPLDVGSLRIIAANVIGNTSEGMLLDGNTAPSFQRVNSATDKALRVIWASSSSVECQFPPVPKPPDMDGAVDATVHLMLGKDTNTDNTVTVDIQVFDGVGDTECGAATAALGAAALAEYSATVALADLGEHPGFLNISLIPGTHTTDAIWLYAAWVEYARK